MTPRIERFLNKYLGPILPKLEDREDVIAQTISKLWRRRESFNVQGVAAWYSYVATTGRRCGLSKLGQSQPVDLDEEIPAGEWTAVDTLAQFADDRRRLYDAADQLWLCVDPEMSPIERKRRLLAAQLVYLDGIAVKDVGEYLGGETSTRSEIDSWLASESTLLDLAYHKLLWENRALTAHLLQPEKPIRRAELTWWVSQAEKRTPGLAPNGMTWDEVAVIVWRYQFGMLTERILQRAGNLDAQFVDDVLRRAESRMPYAESASQLASCFSASWIRSAPLKNTGLWKRLVFQYWVQFELPQKQILHRTQSAAAIAGKTITEGMLNVWLSNGRLFVQLARYAKEAGV